jgi:PAS domain S-box-containing protein
MDHRSILSKTAKGISAKPGDKGLNYDGVRVLRLVNGTATLGELRAKFSDLTDARFEKAVAALESNGLVRSLDTMANAQAHAADARALDAQIQEIGQEFLQTLDFTSLKRTVLNAMRSSPGNVTGGAPPAAAAQPAAAPLAVPPDDAAQEAQLAALRTQILSSLQPKVEEELRATLTATLRPAPESAATPDYSGQMQRVLDCLPVAVYQVDLAGKCLYVNAAWTALTGTTVATTVGHPLFTAFAAPDANGIMIFLDRVINGKQAPPAVEANLASHTGTAKRAALRAAPLTDAGGRLIGACGTLHAARPRK